MPPDENPVLPLSSWRAGPPCTNERSARPAPHIHARLVLEVTSDLVPARWPSGPLETPSCCTRRAAAGHAGAGRARAERASNRDRAVRSGGVAAGDTRPTRRRSCPDATPAASRVRPATSSP